MADRRRILMVLPSIASAIGGPIRSTVANIKAIVKAEPDWEVDLATSDEELTDSWKKEVRAALPDGSKLIIGRNIGGRTYGICPEVAAWVINKGSEYDLLVIRACLHPTSSLAAVAGKARGLPIVVCPHGTLSNYTFRYQRRIRKWVYWQMLERWIIESANIVRCTSDAEADQIVERAGRSKTVVVSHPVPKPAQSDYNNSGKTVLFMGRLHPMKGVRLLVEAFGKVRDSMPSARLIICGDGKPEYVDKVRQDIRDNGLGRAVDYRGFVEGEEKERAFRDASVLVLPTQRENFGIVVAEAMVRGVPVVVTKGYQLWRLVSETGSGFVVERDSESVKRAIVTLLRDPKLREIMAERGRAVAEEEFSLESVGRKLVDLYRPLMMEYESTLSDER